MTQLEPCKYCGAPYKDGCECHPGNRPKPGLEDSRAFSHVTEDIKVGDQVIFDYTSPTPAVVMEINGDQAVISPDDSEELFAVYLSDLFLRKGR